MSEMKNVNDSHLIEQVQGLKGILNVAQVGVSSLELDEVLQNILHSAMSVMDMPAGTVALYDAKTYQLSSPELRPSNSTSLPLAMTTPPAPSMHPLQPSPRRETRSEH